MLTDTDEMFKLYDERLIFAPLLLTSSKVIKDAVQGLFSYTKMCPLFSIYHSLQGFLTRTEMCYCCSSSKRRQQV